MGRYTPGQQTSPLLVAEAALANMGGADGTIVYTTRSPRSMRLKLISANLPAADGLRYFAAAGGKMWERDATFGTAGAALQTTWHVSSVATSSTITTTGGVVVGPGSDANDGLTSATPLATLTELWMRLAGQLLTGAITIQMYGASPAFTETLAVLSANGGSITFQGNRDYTSAVTGTATVVNWVSSSKTLETYTLASGSWTAGRPIEWTGHAGVVSWATSVASLVATSNGAHTVSTAAAFALSASEPYTTYNQPSVNRLTMKIDGQCTVVFNDIEVRETISGNVSFTFNGCRILGVNANDSSNYNVCHFAGATTFGRPVKNTLTGCSAAVPLTVQGFVTIAGQCLVAPGAGSSAVTVDDGGSILVNGALASTGGARCLDAFGASHRINGGFLWANSPTIAVIRLRAGGQIFYTVAANIGATGSTPTNFYQIGVTTPALSTAPHTLPFAGTVLTSSGIFADAG